MTQKILSDLLKPFNIQVLETEIWLAYNFLTEFTDAFF